MVAIDVDTETGLPGMVRAAHLLPLHAGDLESTSTPDVYSFLEPRQASQLDLDFLSLIESLEEEMARNRAAGFQSDRYRGGGVSNQASRAKDETALVDTDGRYRYRPITSREVKKNRPPMPRKIVGEMVIIDVQSRTATAIITRVTSEVHTGDWVEIK